MLPAHLRHVCDAGRNDKGFGFLTPDKGGEDVFVHQSEIRVEGDGYRNLTEGDKVEFEIRQESNNVRCAEPMHPSNIRV